MAFVFVDTQPDYPLSLVDCRRGDLWGNLGSKHMNGGIYSPELWENLIPANVLGGINRAKTAQRDSLGRFVGSNGIILGAHDHGIKGGKIRASNARRNEKGQFVCANT